MFNLVFIIISILVGGIFIFTFLMLFSPRLRGKMMSKQFKSLRYMMDESKDDITSITSNAGDALIKASKKILDNNEDNLKDMATKKANISKEGIEITTSAIKKGFADSKKYCKYCGVAIDEDSKFCKFCGSKQ